MNARPRKPTSRTVTLSLMAPLVLFGVGCSSFDFEIEDSTDEVVLAGNPGLYAVGQPLPPDLIPDATFEFELGQEPAGVYLHEAVLRLTTTVPTAALVEHPFAFVSGIDLVIVSTQEGSTLPPLSLATLTGNPDGQQVRLDVTGANLLPYVREGFELQSNLRGRVPASDLSFRVDLVIGVDVL